MLKNILKSISKDLEQVEEIIKKRLKSDFEEIKPFIEHSLKKKGKMLRPALAVIFGRMVNADMGNVFKIASTLEILHNSTLVHDDVIDNADIRRGQKTHNSIWDNTITVLYGDFMFASAMEIAVEVGNLNVLKEIANVSKSLVTGELLQNSNAFTFPPKREKYFEIIRLKTAVLFSECCVLPVFLSDKENLIDSARLFGEKLGIAFQIIDDCLDFKADIKKLGKPKLIDLPEGKATFPVLLALESGEAEVFEIVKGVFSSRGENFSEADKKLLVKILKSKGYLNSAFSYAKNLISESLELIDNFRDSKYRDMLLKICDFITDREF